MTRSQIQFGVFVFDPETGELARAVDGRHRAIRLRPKTAEVLALLVENAGQLVEREEFQQRVWSDTVIEFDQGINACIREIRSALRDNPEAPSYIETLPRRGYRFIAPVSSSEPIPAAPPAPARRFGYRSLALAAVVVGFVTVAIATTRSRPNRTRSADVVLAVLPLRSLAPAVQRDYLVEGLTEDLIHDLAGANPTQLSVIARTSAATYRDSDKSATDIGNELGAAYLLEGSVRAESDSLRANVRLIRVTDGIPIWVDTYARHVGEVTLLERDLAWGVASGLGITIDSGPRWSVASDAADSTVRDLLFRARYLLSDSNADAVDRATTILLDALDRDTDNATALVMLARARLRRGDDVDGRSLSQRALDADSTNVDARLLAGQIALADFDWPAAASHLAWAAEAAPGRPDAQIQRAYIQTALGELGAGVRAARQAIKLDPVVPSVRGDVGWIFYYAGNLKEAVSQCQKMLDLSPESRTARICLLMAHWRLGRMDDAYAQARAIAAQEGIDGELPIDLPADIGIERFLTAAVGMLLSGSPTTWDRYEAARALMLLDRPVEAVRHLELAAEAGPAPALTYVGVEPAFAPLHTNARFKAIVTRVGLAEWFGN